MSPSYDPDWIRTYYDAYGDKEWNRWDTSPVERLKLHVHLHYLRAHIASSDRVLEIGAGAGRFTEALAETARSIVVADLSPGQLELNRANAARLGFEDAVEDWVACDLCRLQPRFEVSTFDAVVCYGGPLSYVFDDAPHALAQCRNVLKPGGTLLLSVMSLWGTIHQFLPGVLDIAPAANRRIVDSGNLTPENVGPDRHYTHMFRCAELRSMLEDARFDLVAVSASNALSTGWEGLLDGVPEGGTVWNHLLELEIEACQQSGCLDLGSHLIAVCRRIA